MEIDEIEKLKSDCEFYITKILKQLEKETGCRVQSLDLFTRTEEEDNNFEVDINLRLRHRVDIIGKK